jgi:hypothetical protein
MECWEIWVDGLVQKQNKKQQQLNIHRLHPFLNYILSVPEWHRFLLDKGVAILDLPMILLPNETINKYMQNMKN